MSIPSMIRERRIQLGLGEAELAERIGVGLDAYCDVELYEDEFFDCFTLGSARRLCHVLGLDLTPMIEAWAPGALERGSLCGVRYIDGRSQLISQALTENNLSTRDLAECIGFEEVAVENFLVWGDFLESWPIDLVLKIASVLKLPAKYLILP